MKLKELSARTGETTATLKFWMREGILPAGVLRNQTTAAYDEGHVERAALIRTLRERFDTPIAAIRSLTGMIDDDAVPLLDVMERCQMIATGLRDDGGPEEPDEASAQARELLEEAGWPVLSSVARDALAAALRDSARAGFPVPTAGLLRYVRALAEIAEGDVASIRPEGSRDAVARNLLLGASTQARVLLAMNQLAHTSAAIAEVLAAEGARPGPE